MIRSSWRLSPCPRPRRSKRSDARSASDHVHQDGPLAGISGQEEGVAERRRPSGLASSTRVQVTLDQPFKPMMSSAYLLRLLRNVPPVWNDGVVT